jgi:hypothetical protein
LIASSSVSSFTALEDDVEKERMKSGEVAVGLWSRDVVDFVKKTEPVLGDDRSAFAAP